jgi:DNA-binding CsgD family transcriptional regulator
VLYLEGQWAETRRAGQAALAVAHGIWQVLPRLILGALARTQGQADLAWDTVRDALPQGPATEPGDTVYLAAVLAQRLAAALALDAGDLSAARAWLAAHDRWLAWSGSVLGRAEGHLLWSAYHRSADAAAPARRHAEWALAHATEPRQPLALLVAHRLLGELDTEVGNHAEAEAHLDQALALADACAAPYERALTLLALADACAAPYERALTLLALAELHAAGGRPGQASAPLDEARAVFARLEAKPALARADALAAGLLQAPSPPTGSRAPDYPAGLSAREAEVLRLVAQGLTNAQVADRLSLSPRTVDRHLNSVYTKLGVSSRSAATRFALEHGLA